MYQYLYSIFEKNVLKDNYISDKISKLKNIHLNVFSSISLTEPNLHLCQEPKSPLKTNENCNKNLTLLSWYQVLLNKLKEYIFSGH